MAKPRATQQDVDAFIQAVCPETPALYAAAFSEKKCLNDATEIITRYREALTTIKKWGGGPAYNIAEAALKG